MLGRCFMDHPHVDSGRVHFTRDVPLHLVYTEAARHGFAACIVPPQELTDEVRVPAVLLPAPCPSKHDSIGEAGAAVTRPQAAASARRGFAALGQAELARQRVVRDCALAGIGPREFVLNHRIEQAPNPSSRIVLLDERDAVGRRRAGVDWRLCDADARTLEVGQAAALRYLERIGATRIRPSRTDEEFLAARGSTYWHHIGTTRMGDAPADSVVDRDCKVHGVENLSVAGSSVFCRATFSPPTMTIVAFALRLADAVDRRLRDR